MNRNHRSSEQAAALETEDSKLHGREHRRRDEEANETRQKHQPAFSNAVSAKESEARQAMPEERETQSAASDSSTVKEKESGDNDEAGDNKPKKELPSWVKPVGLSALAIAVILGAIWGVRFWSFSKTHVATDDAYLTTDVVQITPQVSGKIAQIVVSENQPVKAGQLLATLDDATFRASVAQAQANLAVAQGAASNVGLTSRTGNAQIEQAKAGVSQAESAIRSAQAAVKAAQANADRAAKDAARMESLFRQDAVSAQSVDASRAAAISARAQLESARQQVSQAQAERTRALGQLAQAQAAPQQLAVSQANQQTAKAHIQEAQAALENAEIALRCTRITAPIDGKVSRKTGEIGQQIAVGQPIMSVVPNETVWVIANFKETQLKKVRPGQKVEIKVDALPGHVLTGHVESISAATGATFSLLPPDNATGNFTKVVQRVPVKIVFDPKQEGLDRLIGGASVTATIATQ